VKVPGYKNYPPYLSRHQTDTPFEESHFLDSFRYPEGYPEYPTSAELFNEAFFERTFPDSNPLDLVYSGLEKQEQPLPDTGLYLPKLFESVYPITDLSGNIRVPGFIDLKFRKNKCETRQSLQAAIIHIPSTNDSMPGHYVSIVRDPQNLNRWKQFDDEEVNWLSMEEAVELMGWDVDGHPRLETLVDSGTRVEVLFYRSQGVLDESWILPRSGYY
jgi:hypothetical protein